MATHYPLIQGLVHLIRINRIRGQGFCGQLELDGEIVFESEFPSYKDAYWALKEIDANVFMERGDYVS